MFRELLPEPNSSENLESWLSYPKCGSILLRKLFKEKMFGLVNFVATSTRTKMLKHLQGCVKVPSEVKTQQTQFVGKTVADWKIRRQIDVQNIT